MFGGLNGVKSMLDRVIDRIWWTLILESLDTILSNDGSTWLSGGS
jgi:hypothetical protein